VMKVLFHTAVPEIICSPPRAATQYSALKISSFPVLRCLPSFGYLRANILVVYIIGADFWSNMTSRTTLQAFFANTRLRPCAPCGM
jgi:hypothetical protein